MIKGDKTGKTPLWKWALLCPRVIVLVRWQEWIVRGCVGCKLLLIVAHVVSMSNIGESDRYCCNNNRNESRVNQWDHSSWARCATMSLCCNLEGICSRVIHSHVHLLVRWWCNGWSSMISACSSCVGSKLVWTRSVIFLSYCRTR